MSQNCMKNLGLPPTLVFKQNGVSIAGQAIVVKPQSQGLLIGNNERAVSNDLEDQSFGGNSYININR